MQFTATLALVLTAVFVGMCDAQNWGGRRRGRGGLGGIIDRGIQTIQGAGNILGGGGDIARGLGQLTRAWTNQGGRQACCNTAIPQRCLPEFVYPTNRFPQGCPSEIARERVWTFDGGRCRQRGILRNVFKGVFDGLNLYNSRDSCNSHCIDPRYRGQFDTRGRRGGFNGGFRNQGYGNGFDNGFDNHVNGPYRQGGQYGSRFGGQQYFD